MSHRRTHRKNLSKGILDMKFMKKSKEKIERDIQETESTNFFANDLTKSMKSDGTQFIIEHSMVPIEGLLCGRMSFKGMNPEVERLMQQEREEIMEQEKAKDRLKSNQPEISDVDMARHLGKTVRKKFTSKNGNVGSEDSEDESDESDHSPPKKAKFMKPVDD